MSAGDWIILGAVLLAVGAAAFFAVRRRKRGCSCGCGGCAARACCKKGADKSEEP